jgi:hypothetical protein
MPWDLTGNSGIKPATNYLGTKDARPLTIRTNNAERMRITPDGNVGIGTTAPRANLEVAGGMWNPTDTEGDLKIGDATYRLKIGVATGGGGAGDVRIRAHGGTNRLMLGSGTSDTLFVVGDHIGIGTMTPNSKLVVSGTSRAISIDAGENNPNVAGALGFNRNVTDGQIFDAGFNVAYQLSAYRAGLYFEVYNGAGESVADHPLAISSAGKVGIGTSGPTRPLHVSTPGSDVLMLQSTRGGGGNTANLDFQTYATIGQNYPTASVRAIDDGTYSSHVSLLTKTSGANTNALQERMRISSNGNVGIGTAVPSERLEVVGNIKVSGDVLLAGADCAEDFDVSSAEQIEPGTILVIDDEGVLRESSRAYDRRVAGVVSGGGNYRAGLILDKQESKADRMPVALMGKVYCKVDARRASVEVGDLLTTASTPGYAMKADDPTKAFGAVLGKALRSLTGTQDIIPVLVALQ